MWYRKGTWVFRVYSIAYVVGMQRFVCCVYVSIHADDRLCDRRSDRCVCVGQTYRCVRVTISIDVLRLLPMLLIRFFNEICMAFCIQCCVVLPWQDWQDKTVNKRCCTEWPCSSFARSPNHSFVCSFMHSIPDGLAGWLPSYKNYVCAPSDRPNTSVSVEFHFILQNVLKHTFSLLVHSLSLARSSFFSKKLKWPRMRE